MARYTHMPTFISDSVAISPHLDHILTGCREKTQLQLLWLGYHRTEKLFMGEDRGVGEKVRVCATLSPHTWQLELRSL